MSARRGKGYEERKVSLKHHGVFFGVRCFLPGQKPFLVVVTTPAVVSSRIIVAQPLMQLVTTDRDPVI